MTAILSVSNQFNYEMPETYVMIILKQSLGHTVIPQDMYK
jgi:hypothetical protein